MLTAVGGSVAKTNRQLGVPEEALEEVWTESGTPSLAADRGRNRIGVVWSEVRQASVLEIAPDLLLRIEFGSVARGPERMPVSVYGEIGANDLMAVGLAPVPQEQQMPRVVPAELAREVEDLGAAYVLLGVKGVMRRRRGGTTRAPMPETFSWERLFTTRIGVCPRGAQVRRISGAIMNPVSSRQIRRALRRASFFWPGSTLAEPTHGFADRCVPWPQFVAVAGSSHTHEGAGQCGQGDSARRSALG